MGDGRTFTDMYCQAVLREVAFQQVRCFLYLIDPFDPFLQGDQAPLFSIFDLGTIVVIYIVSEEISHALLTKMFSQVAKRQISVEMEIPVQALIVLCLNIHHPGIGRKHILILHCGEVNAGILPFGEDQGTTLRILYPSVVTAVVQAIFPQCGLIDHIAVLAVCVVRLHMGHFIQHATGGTVAHMAVNIALFLIVDSYQVAGFFFQGFFPVFPGALHGIILISFQEGDQAVHIFPIAHASFADEIPVVHNGIPSALFLQKTEQFTVKRDKFCARNHFICSFLTASGAAP